MRYDFKTIINLITISYNAIQRISHEITNVLSLSKFHIISSNANYSKY